MTIILVSRAAAAAAAATARRVPCSPNTLLAPSLIRLISTINGFHDHYSQSSISPDDVIGHGATTSCGVYQASSVPEATVSFCHPCAPKIIGWIPENDDEAPAVQEMMNRNKRTPRGANRGKRPCSHMARRAKKRAIGRRSR